MKKVAKLVVIDKDDQYLMMYRSDHPDFGRDADLPGGTLEAGETLEEGLIREVREETGITVVDAKELYSSTAYYEGELDSVFVTRVGRRPEIVMSWEHSRYEWISKQDFLKIAKNARDNYMHMVHDAIASR